MKTTIPKSVFLCVSLALLLTGCGAGEQDAAVSEKDNIVVHVEQKLTEDKATVAEASAVAVATEENYDAHPGKGLHDTNCISCHDSAAYTREDRKISDFPKLLAQVHRCDANLGSRLFDEELAQVADYLNKAYYKYEK